MTTNTLTSRIDRIFILFAICALIILINVALSKPEEPKKAIITEREGMFIYILSKSTDNYEFLGTVNRSGVVMSTKPENMFSGLLKKAKKEYPNANGIIIHDIALEKADCIFLK